MAKVINFSGNLRAFEKNIEYFKGPIHIKHFYDVSKQGINAIRIYLYIRTVQNIMYSDQKNYHLPVPIDNKKLFQWYGVNSNKKWTALNKLEKNNIIELSRSGIGKSPIVRFRRKKYKFLN